MALYSLADFIVDLDNQHDFLTRQCMEYRYDGTAPADNESDLSAAQIIAGKTGNVGVLAMKNASVKYQGNTGIPIPAVGEINFINIYNYLFRAEWVIQFMPKKKGE